MNLKNFLLVPVILCSMLLFGCTRMIPPKPTFHFDVQTPAQRQAKLASVQFWYNEGALSIQQPGAKPIIANFNWFYLSPKGYRIQIVSALGLYRVEIIYQMKSVTFWKNGMHVATAKTPQGLMEQTMGWSLPLNDMFYWIKGMIAPDKESRYFAQYDPFGHLIFLKQKGWTIRYAGYVTDSHCVDLPQVITLERNGICAKIVIKQWHLLAYHHTPPEMLVD